MAYVGLRYCVGATIAEEPQGAPITYNTGVVVGKMIGATINMTRNNNPLYADDDIAEDDNSITGGTISLNLDDVGDETLATLGIVKQQDADGEGVTEYRETGEATPYMGVGYIRVRRKKGKTTYEAFWVHKCMLAIQNETAETKGQTINWQTPTLEGTLMGVRINSDGSTDYRVRAKFDTPADAMAWLNAKANITDGGP